MADTSRRETMCLQRTNQKTSQGKECYIVLPFQFVEYDGKPERYLEPASVSPYIKGVDSDPAPFDALVEGRVFAGIEIFDSVSTMWEGVHEFHFC